MSYRADPPSLGRIGAKSLITIVVLLVIGGTIAYVYDEHPSRAEPAAEMAIGETSKQSSDARSSAEAIAEAKLAEASRAVEAAQYAAAGRPVPPELQGLEARLTCRAGGMLMPLAMCFVPTSGMTGSGRLVITSGNETRAYSIVDFNMGEFSDGSKTIDLDRPYTVIAQANGNPAAVLRLEIREKGQTLLTQEATQFSVAMASE